MVLFYNSKESKMNIDDLTIGEAKQLASMFSPGANPTACGLNQMIGKECIVRTVSAGVWFGLVAEKSGSEVILKDARRMWRWKAAKSISLSGVVAYGIDQAGSKITPPVGQVWLEAIELIPIGGEPAASIKGAPHVDAQ